MTQRIPTIDTRVGRAGWRDHRYCGLSLYEQILGNETLAGLIGLGVSGRRIGRQEAELLDDIACIVAIPDPRVWPVKLVRVVSAYGGILAGFGAGLLAMDRAAIGSWNAQTAAEMLIELNARTKVLGLSGAVCEQRERRGRLPGFGVPARATDERVTVLTARIRQAGRSHLRWWTFAQAVIRVVREGASVEPNIGVALAGAFLDLGFRSHEIGPLASILLVGAFLPNAVEGAAQAPEVLRSIPREFVEYRGVAPRSSPRAEAARARKPGPED